MSTRKIIRLLLTLILLVSGCAYHAEIVRLPDTPLYNRTVIFNNVQYLALLRYCEYYNLEWDWDLVSQRIEVKKGKDVLVLRPNFKLALVNDKPIELDHPVEYKRGAAYIPAETALFISEDIFGLKERLVPSAKLYPIRNVVIDPGHGGKDPGAISRYGTKEKNIVLDISKRLKRHMEKNGFKVSLKRDRDKFIYIFR